MGSFRPSPPVLANSVHGGNSEWDTAGPAMDPALILKATWVIGGANFHVQAYRVWRNDEGTQNIDTRGFHDWSQDDEAREIVKTFDELHDAFAADGGFVTITIDGSDYALFVYPFSP